MPELPEVETYVRELQPTLQGCTILGAEVRWPRTIAAPTPEAFPDAIRGQRFEQFGRRGKYMLLGLASGDTLIVHLRMTGKLFPSAADSPVDKHTHVLFKLDDGRHLHYRDPRKFGRIWLVADPQPILAKLGPEPLSDDFSVTGFGEALVGRKAAIKALLLDQKLVAGVGNIYADEALYLAGLRPARAGGNLKKAEVKRLHEAVRMVLERGIAFQGSSLGGSGLQNYLRPGGQQGGFQEEFKVFRRTGKPCPKCGTLIERIIIAQRSTHFCPSCQV